MMFEIVILLALLLYPSPLWDPPPPPELAKSDVSKDFPANPPAKSMLALKALSPLDEKVFSSALNVGQILLPCLRKSVGETGSITFMARLAQNGQLSGVRLIQHSSAAACAIPALEKMNFASVAASLDDESVEISWRFDW